MKNLTNFFKTVGIGVNLCLQVKLIRTEWLDDQQFDRQLLDHLAVLKDGSNTPVTFGVFITNNIMA